MNEFGSKCRVIKLQIKKFTSFNTSGGSHNVDYATLCDSRSIYCNK